MAMPITSLKGTGLSLFRRALCRIQYGKVLGIAQEGKGAIGFIKQGKQVGEYTTTVYDPAKKKVIRSIHTKHNYRVGKHKDQILRTKIVKDGNGTTLHGYETLFGDSYEKTLGKEVVCKQRVISRIHSDYTNPLAARHDITAFTYEPNNVWGYDRTIYKNCIAEGNEVERIAFRSNSPSKKPETIWKKPTTNKVTI